jgi:hypothetical protein
MASGYQILNVDCANFDPAASYAGASGHGGTRTAQVLRGAKKKARDNNRSRAEPAARCLRNVRPHCPSILEGVSIALVSTGVNLPARESWRAMEDPGIPQGVPVSRRYRAIHERHRGLRAPEMHAAVFAQLVDADALHRVEPRVRQSRVADLSAADRCGPLLVPNSRPRSASRAALTNGIRRMLT